MCRDLLRETRREQSKPGDGQTQGKQAEKQTTRRGRKVTKSRVIKPRVYPKQSSFAPHPKYFSMFEISQFCS